VRIDWNNGDTSDWSEMFRSGDTMTVEYAWSAPGGFKISAQAKDEKGAVSAWSNWHAVTIADTVNVPPDAPSAPAGPDGGLAHSIYEFSSSAGEPNGDRVRVQFDWGDGDTSDWGNLVAESTTVTAAHWWHLAGEYSVAARASDARGLVSDWSNVHIMVVTEDPTNAPPGIPLVPTGPDSGYVGPTYEFSTAGGDPDGDSILLQFDWGNGDTSDWSAPVPESSFVMATHSWTTIGDYLVRARAKDVNDLVSDWSDIHILTVKDSLR
jgi:hypothetical protein